MIEEISSRKIDQVLKFNTMFFVLYLEKFIYYINSINCISREILFAWKIRAINQDCIRACVSACVRAFVCMVHLYVKDRKKEEEEEARKTRRKVRVSQSSNSGSRGGPIANLLLRRAGVIIHIYINIYININIYIYTILYIHCTPLK